MRRAIKPLLYIFILLFLIVEIIAILGGMYSFSSDSDFVYILKTTLTGMVFITLMVAFYHVLRRKI